MESATKKWDKRYSNISVPNSLDVDLLLKKYIKQAYLFESALDVASGTCKSSVFLATCGFTVTAVDCSRNGLAVGQRLADRYGGSLNTIVLDLEKSGLPEGNWSVICCFRYLNIPLLKSAVQHLSPGGLLIFKTFNENHLKNSSKFRKGFLLQPGELINAFPFLDIIELSDGMEENKTMSWIVGQKNS